MFLAFLLREHPTGGVSGTVLAGAVIAAAGIGNSLGTALGSLLKARNPELIVMVVLVLDAALAVVVAVLYGLIALVVLGLVAGLCSSLGKLSLDALIQRDIPDSVRTSVFARSETVLQLAWVIGGGFGIVMPLVPRLGFGFLAGVLVVMLFFVLRPGAVRARTKPPGSAEPASERSRTTEDQEGRTAPARATTTTPVRRAPNRPPGRPYR
jgi:MFS family permease